jgi:hypothetical protein
VSVLIHKGTLSMPKTIFYNLVLVPIRKKRPIFPSHKGALGEYFVSYQEHLGSILRELREILRSESP